MSFFYVLSQIFALPAYPDLETGISVLPSEGKLTQLLPPRQKVLLKLPVSLLRTNDLRRRTGLVQLTNNLLIRVDSWFQKEETSNISKVKTLLVNGHFLGNNFEISTITLFSQWSRTQHIFTFAQTATLIMLSLMQLRKG
jgi:hypothetical protein